jgi:hypothetical protein
MPLDSSQVFSAALVKEAAEKTDRKRPSYREAMIAATPFSAVQAAVDFPRGALDKAVQRKVLHSSKLTRALGKPPRINGKKPKTWKAVVRTGSGRAAGRLVGGIPTAPVFLSGLKDLKEGKTKEQKRRGWAKILGSGAAYSGIKGFTEGKIDPSGKPGGRRAQALMLSRAAIGLGASGLTAHQVSKRLKTPKKKKKSSGFKRDVGLGLAGAGIGAGKGIGDLLSEVKFGDKKLTRRTLASSAAGRAAAGAAGAVVLGKLVKKFAPKEKKASGGSNFYLGPTPTEMYMNSRAWARSTDVNVLKARFDAIVATKQAEATPTRRAMTYALQDELARRGQKTQVLPVRERTRPPVLTRPTNVIDTALMASVLAAPRVVWETVLGPMPADARDHVLREALDQYAINRHIEVQDAAKSLFGNFDPSFEQLDDGTKIIRRGASGLPEDVAHELGHATAGRTRRATIASPQSLKVGKAASLASVIVPLLALQGVGDGAFATPEELESRAKFISGLGKVTAALQAPMLAEEAVASGKGLRLMHRAGAAAPQLQRAAIRNLGAFATHATPAAAPFLVAAYLRAKAKRAKRRAKFHENAARRNR